MHATSFRTPFLVITLSLLGACRSATAPDQASLVSGTGAAVRWAETGNVCDATSPATPLSAAARDSLPARSHMNTNDQWADIATRVPGGWGGILRRDGVPTIILVDTTRRVEAIAAVQFEGLAASSLSVAEQGRWDFAQLNDWYRYLLPRVHPAGGISATDIDEANNRITLRVIDEAARGRVEAALTQAGIPCYLVAIGIAPYATPW